MNETKQEKISSEGLGSCFAGVLPLVRRPCDRHNSYYQFASQSSGTNIRRLSDNKKLCRAQEQPEFLVKSRRLSVLGHLCEGAQATLEAILRELEEIRGLLDALLERKEREARQKVRGIIDTVLRPPTRRSEGRGLKAHGGSD